MSETWDVVVIGAGAAGLVAATRAAERGLKTLLLEKNKRPGVKILMSGGTRCNLTHHCDRRGIIDAYGKKQGSFLHSALAALSPQEVVAMVEAEGCLTKVEETGKIFPVSNRATDILAAFMQRLERSGAKLALSDAVRELEVDADGQFKLTTVDRSLVARRVILTTGGKSYPGCGTTGDGYKLAARFGHTIVAPVPALVPIRINAEWVQDLKGITLPDVGVKVVQRAGTDGANGEPTAKPVVLAETRNSLLFAHFGLTGPAALDPSRVVARAKKPGDLDVVFDFLPDIKLDPLDEQLRERAARDGKKQVAGLLPEHLPQRLREQLIMLAGLEVESRAAVLSKGDRRKLAGLLKGLTTPALGTLGFEKAEVTAGGVALEEVDSRTLESKLQPGFHLAGEVLDLDGPIGGFNFQAAFSTGYLAGQSV